MLDFMKLTIDAHNLQVWNLGDAANLLPGEGSYQRAKKFAETTNYFERKDVLIPDKNYVYPPLSSLAKSFEKWLALQEHDVRAVNSLYQWRRAVELAHYELTDQDDFDEGQALQLYLLENRLSEAIDKVKAGKIIKRTVA